MLFKKKLLNINKGTVNGPARVVGDAFEGVITDINWPSGKNILIQIFLKIFSLILILYAADI